MKFSSYNLSKDLLEVINNLGYIDLTPIQEATITKVLKGKSLICKSETGSGKTHAFLIPTLNNVDRDLNAIQVLIVTPTTILANQTYEFARAICEQIEGLSCKVFTSSKDKNKNLEELSYGKEMPKVVIGTPGRIVDLLINNKTNISRINTIVLDEADMLLDDSYINDIVTLMERINPKQRLIFTATMKNHLISDTYKFIKAEEIIDIDKKVKVNRNVKHHLVDIKHKDIVEQLINFLNIENPYFTLIFASEKTKVEKIYRQLNQNGITCSILNGNMQSRENKINLRRIKQGEFNVVVCSDMVSRGLDLEDVSTVISCDLPKDLDYYLHRAGRCGRNNKKGDSYIFYNDDELTLVKKLIESKLGFDYYILRKDSLKKVDTIEGKPKKKNEELEKEIRKEVRKVKTNKVKPGYKKKISKAIEKAKKNHKEKIIRKNLKEKRKLNKSL
ncbi:MAG: DEAD/DEAH box helicase [Erysipelotrichaceae bacterium]|nr:DEAD/DEAH box helicase [Erysipelotrichaceae bacterium]